MEKNAKSSRLLLQVVTTVIIFYNVGSHIVHTISALEDFTNDDIFGTHLPWFKVNSACTWHTSWLHFLYKTDVSLNYSFMIYLSPSEMGVEW